MKKIIISLIVMIMLSVCVFGAQQGNPGPGFPQQGDPDPENVATHTVEEIVGGTFPDSEDYVFQGDVNIEAPESVEGVSLLYVDADEVVAYAIKAESGSSAGIYGTSDQWGVYGTGTDIGVYGYSYMGSGVKGYGDNSYGVYGKTDSFYSCGVKGRSDYSGNTGALGCSNYGLYVVGDAKVTEDLYVDSCDNCDLAENFNAAEKLTPGDVVVINPNGEKSLLLSTESYDTTVAGIVSTDPTLTMGTAEGKRIPLALSGVVPTKVSAENGPIEVGDLLTTSNTPGHAMKCDDKRKCFGSLVGKALEPLDKGTGTVIALVMLG